MKKKIKCDECQQETINVSTSKITSEGFILTINKCTNCGFQKDFDSFFKDINLLSGNTVKLREDCVCDNRSGTASFYNKTYCLDCTKQIYAIE